MTNTIQYNCHIQTRIFNLIYSVDPTPFTEDLGFYRINPTTLLYYFRTGYHVDISRLMNIHSIAFDKRLLYPDTPFWEGFEYVVLNSLPDSVDIREMQQHYEIGKRIKSYLDSNNLFTKLYGHWKLFQFKYLSI